MTYNHTSVVLSTTTISPSSMQECTELEENQRWAQQKIAFQKGLLKAQEKLEFKLALQTGSSQILLVLGKSWVFLFNWQMACLALPLLIKQVRMKCYLSSGKIVLDNWTAHTFSSPVASINDLKVFRGFSMFWHWLRKSTSSLWREKENWNDYVTYLFSLP